MPRQLTFELPARPALGRGEFFVSPANAAALDAVEGWRDWPDARLALAGPKGSGKSHLVWVWAAAAAARVIAGAGLDAATVEAEATAAGPLAVDDADALAGSGEGEEAAFHLLNLMREARRPLLLAGRMPPAQWPVALPDLASRLQAMPVARLAPPDDALLAAVLVKLFADRQLAVSPSVVTFLGRRLDRTFEAAAAAVEALDRAALAEKRPVTTRLARAVLDKLAPGGA